MNESKLRNILVIRYLRFMSFPILGAGIAMKCLSLKEDSLIWAFSTIIVMIILFLMLLTMSRDLNWIIKYCDAKEVINDGN